MLHGVKGLRPEPCLKYPEELNEKNFPPHKLALRQGCTESFSHISAVYGLNICMWYITQQLLLEVQLVYAT